MDLSIPALNSSRLVFVPVTCSIRAPLKSGALQESFANAAIGADNGSFAKPSAAHVAPSSSAVVAWPCPTRVLAQTPAVLSLSHHLWLGSVVMDELLICVSVFDFPPPFRLGSI